MTGRVITFWLGLAGSVTMLLYVFLYRSGEESVSRQLDRMAGSRGDVSGLAEKKTRPCRRLLPEPSQASRPLCFLAPTVLLMLLTRSWWSLFISLPCGLILPGMVEKLRESRRKKALRAQLYDFLDAMIQSLEGGFSVYQALEFSAVDVPPPLSIELTRAVSDIEFGREFDEAIELARERVDEPVFDTMVDTLLLLKQSGGNLPLLLRKLRQLMREKEEAERELRVNTTQGRWSGYVVASLPLAFLAVESVFSPSLVSPLFTTPAGLTLLAAGLGLDAAGFLCVRRISHLGRSA